MDATAELPQEDGLGIDLHEYLATICPALLGLGRDDVGFRQALESPEAAALTSRFSSDAHSSALFVELHDSTTLAALEASGARPTSLGSSADTGGDVGTHGEEGRDGRVGEDSSRSVVVGGFVLGLDARHMEDVPGVVIIKRTPGGLEPKGQRPLQAQLQASDMSVMTFPGVVVDEGPASGGSGARGGKGEFTPKNNSPSPSTSSSSVFAVLQAYVTHAFAPAVRAYSSTTGGDDKHESGVSALQRRITELDQALDRCQKRLEIPTVRLTPHPELEAAVAKVVSGGKVDLERLGLGSRIQDDAFLNRVQAGVTVWVKDIQRLTRLANRSVHSFPESAAEEIHFWSSLGEALEMTKLELRSPGVEVTRALLNQGKRFLAVMALDTATGLKDAVDIAADTNAFLRTFPLEPLLAAQSPKDVGAALLPVFNHFKQKYKHSQRYNPERAAQLLESISHAFAQQLAMCLGLQGDKRLMSMDYKDFALLMEDSEKAFAIWKKARAYPEYTLFESFFSDQCKRRIKGRSHGSTLVSGHSLLNSLSWEHPPLSARLKEVAAFRLQHERMRGVVGDVLKDEDSSALQEVDEAYARLPGSDVLDLSPEGSRRWADARAAYDRRVDGLEARVSALLEGRLRTARTAEEMFRVFAKFNPLFVRPRIRTAISQFQQDLIGHVKESVTTLQDKFRHRYEVSEAKTYGSLRDIPPVAGKILWAQQMERQLRLLTARLSNVLGDGWESHVDGRPLKAVCDELLRNLDTNRIYRQWRDEWTAHNDEIPHDHMLLKASPPYRKGHLALAINFDDKTTQLFKEVRHLQYLGLLYDEGEVGVHKSKIRRMASKAETRYPTALALQGILRTYAQTSRAFITSETELLLVRPLLSVRLQIKEAFQVRKRQQAHSLSGSPTTSSQAQTRMEWGSNGLSDWVASLGEQVFTLQEKATDVSELVLNAEERLQEIDKCAFQATAMRQALSSLQDVLDKMSLADCSNLGSWVRRLDQRVEAVLARRLEQAVTAWVKAFGDLDDTDQRGDGPEDVDTADSMHSPQDGEGVWELGGEGEVAGLQMECTVHEVLLRNQVLYLSPPLEHARAAWISQFHTFLQTVCGLPRLRSKTFAVFGAGEGEGDGDGDGEESYRRVVHNIPLEILRKAYQEIEARLAEVGEYVESWLQYQSLWDMPVQSVTTRLGTDISAWARMLQEAKSARSMVEASAGEKVFGPVIVDYSSVQSKVNLKYDAWQKELQGKFASILAEEIHQAHRVLVEAKSKLEATMLEGATRDVVRGVTYIQEMRQRQKALSKQTEALVTGERLLMRQRHQFPPGWPQTSMVEAAFADFDTILVRRGRSMEEQIPLLRGKVGAEAKAVEKRLGEMLSGWEKGKPLSQDHSPAQALDTLGRFETMATRLRTETDLLSAARDALSLEPTGRDLLAPVQEEMKDLKEVWEAMSHVWEKISELEETSWSVAIPRKIRKALDGVLDHMRTLPNRVRQYEPYDHAQVTLRRRLETVTLITDLRSEALKDRHWRPLLRRLGVRVAFSELTLGLLWGVDLAGHKKSIADIVLSAQGEMALEEFLRQVREEWQGKELELVSYQGRVQLIKGWDTLFSRLEEHLNGLSSMRGSPYFHSVQEFQEEAGIWEERLTRLNSVLDSWVDVQRRWLYLEGIFFASRDIKAQLPAEFSRFKSVDIEFVQLMRRVAHKPSVLEVLSMENLQRQLERQFGLMEHIQKALGDYLEGQRQTFSRFYFVGDEDLLEIVGNANEPAKVVQHLGKMFASIGGITMTAAEDGPAMALSMVSKDGEEVTLRTPVQLSREGVKEWLGSLEKEMRLTLAHMLREAVNNTGLLTDSKEGDAELFVRLCGRYSAQIVALAAQISWSTSVLKALEARAKGMGTGKDSLSECLGGLSGRLQVMSQSVLGESPPMLRKKYEQLITELVRQRDSIRRLQDAGTSGPESFDWLTQLRFEMNNGGTDPAQGLTVHMANASFLYGFEYLGIGERLVQTPLTDRCYLTLTQALHLRMGGNPFGPAGTGKTESVKALGAQLGRFVLVFNCDESFDYSAMGRLFAGLCQVGAWGCFDEFNRLEERILSAVSQQILAIQKGLLHRQPKVEFLGRSVRLHPDVGIFVTMNPGYAGRSNLPDNLKQLFRAVAMVAPDRKLIAQVVMLFSQGISTAEELAGRIVLLFQLCQEQLSSRPHYDFGLRALKSVLVGAGGLKRKALQEMAAAGMDGTQTGSLGPIERDVLIRSTCNTVVPKLVAQDYSLFASLLNGVFPGCQVASSVEEEVRTKLVEVCASRRFVMGEAWVEKVLQLKQMLELRHGVMMVGPSGSGKSSAWQCLLHALELSDGIKGEVHVIDPKAIGKEALYGHLDPTTLEWTDGIFTKVLREVLTNKRGEAIRRQWIVFDGDVDPEWAENLNSVLDDNKILTLPSGERLEVPENVRIMLEVDSLQYATLATVSRCGMVWFSAEEEHGEGTVTTEMLLRHKMCCLKHEPVSLLEGSTAAGVSSGESAGGAEGQGASTAQADFVRALEPLFFAPISEEDKGGPIAMGGGGGGGGGRFDDERLVPAALAMALSCPHVMETTRERLVETLCSLLERGVGLVLEYNEGHPDFPVHVDVLERFALRWLLHSVVWGFGGSMSTAWREKLGHLVTERSGLPPPPRGLSLVDLQAGVRVEDGEWVPWSASVPRTQLEPQSIVNSDVVVTTTDTVRHVEVLKAWLASHKPLILCGPPGSGKTMTLTSTLSSMPNLVLASLNFSSSSDPDLILKAFKQHCEYVRTPRGLVLQPQASLGVGKWLVIFCDEVNLPEEASARAGSLLHDKYGTQRVVSFLRQLYEQGGFWRASDRAWVKLRRVQFVGACNPPTDAGRQVLPNRFLRHAPLMLVDSPARESLMQIYRAFNAALLKLHPQLKGHLDGLTSAMIDFYELNQGKFTSDQHPQYIYSPRELSRWVRALYEAMQHLDAMTLEELVRLWGNEALRLFHDRLVTQEERDWCADKVDEVAFKHFPMVGRDALTRPLLFSCWLSKARGTPDYTSVDKQELSSFLQARLRVFYEEELDVPLVLFDGVLEHVLRIDRVLRQPMGHLLLVGEAGAGKTVLSRFVSWMNGLSIFQVKASNRYTLDHFDQDLRSVMWRVGVQGEHVCFIFDESNVLSSAFLERMNALLASGEVPGLYEGKELAALMAGCREAAQRDGVLVDSEDELFRRFTTKVQRGLHVVFTMNPASEGFQGRCATSPALFNRCVVDWFGTWPTQALAQVGYEFTSHVDTGAASWSVDEMDPLMDAVKELVREEGVNARHAVVAALVAIHRCVKEATEAPPSHASAVRHYVSPRDFLGLIRAFVAVVNERRAGLEDQQLHINVGLNKLQETQAGVEEMQRGLEQKECRLREKDELANAKLQQMVAGQNEAERRKRDAEALTLELEEQNNRIAERRQQQAEADLSEAEPALLAAQSSVRSIKKPMLDEIRTLTRPPKAVQTVLEAVAIMLGHQEPQWSDVRKVISKADFIATVVNFDTDSLTSSVIKTVEEVFRSAGDLTQDSVTRASKACGPLYQWVHSQINFSRIFIMVQPLKDEIAHLQEESAMSEKQKLEVEAQIVDMEESIARYKEEYAEAIREIEAVKAEMEAVKQKVTRAEALLCNLEQERDRWTVSSKSFTLQLESLIGDCLLAAAFITYVGVFDYRTRKTLVMTWRDLLSSLNVPFRPQLSLSQYLSTAAQRLEWQGMGLPSDDLCLENAVVLERFSRFPLVVDPSGQATRFLLNKYKNRKIATTSFLDASFMKTLASAIRFGTPLLVQDVETVDPVLNPLLNRELQRTGGRTLIRLGSEDIDYSPDFVLVLVTRNPGARFTPDLCSRVTMVNFTVTPASLQSQALGSLLRAERPDVDQRRTHILQLQGEQSVKLRQLEERLLDTISAIQGTILDDDTVVKALEDLKGEAGDVAKEVEHTREVMAEVEVVSGQYEPLAVACSKVYFVLEMLGDVHFLYQYSLRFFQDIMAQVLSSCKGEKEQGKHGLDVTGRLSILKLRLFQTVSNRVCRGLLHRDRLLLALRLAQVYLEGNPEKEPTPAEMETLLRSSGTLSTSAGAGSGQAGKTPQIPGRNLSERQSRELAALCELPSLEPLAAHLANNPEPWARLLDAEEPEKQVPGRSGGDEAASWVSKDIPRAREAFLTLSILKALRPDRILAAAERFVDEVFLHGLETVPDGLGGSAVLPWNEALDLDEAVSEGARPEAPVLLCSEPGHDASWKVDALAESLACSMQSVSMGSTEGYEMADKAMALAAKSGSWVLLRNGHLCPDWLGGLEKKLRALPLHPSFRIFITSEVHPRLPASLLRASEVLVVEAPSGVKANVLRFLRGIPRERMAKPPVERNRLYVLLAWLQAVVQERLRYVPLGWSKRYEFSEGDAACALQAIDSWVEAAANGAQHISPEKVPWEALRALLGQSVYGGRVDSPFDQELLEGFVSSLFRPQSFDLDFPLCSSHEVGEGLFPVTLPDASTPAAFLKWAESLPANNPPTWLGLAPNAEAALLASRGVQLLSSLQIIQDDGLRVEVATAALGGGEDRGAGSNEARLEQLLQIGHRWLGRLPEALQPGRFGVKDSKGDSEDERDALHRCLARELSTGSSLLARVRADLTAVQNLCKGETKATNEVRALVSALVKDIVPSSWKSRLVQANMGAADWVDDFCKRLTHLQTLAHAEVSVGSSAGPYWLGGLFSPDAFITATRQFVACSSGCSLEDLVLEFSINGGSSQGEGQLPVFPVSGLTLEGAGWSEEKGCLAFSQEHCTALPPCHLRWVEREEQGVGRARETLRDGTTSTWVTVPVYLHHGRSGLIIQVQLPTPADIPPVVWRQRGVALLAWSPTV
ncbi:unnamed protein product [Discosporangium mesarthrocarpum]